MQEQLPQSIKQNAGTTHSKAFYTDFKQRSEIEEEEHKLHRYVENMNSKIDYAKWKQELVLKYNYLPMKRITDKIESDKASYLRKIAEEEKNCAKILSGKEITVQLDLFRQFSKKLNQKLHDLQVRIAEEKMKNGMLQQEANSKRLRLKQKMKENMQVIRSTLQREGIHNKQDMITLIRSHSTKDRFNPTALTFDSRKQATSRNIVSRKSSSQQSQRQKMSPFDQLFKECFQKLMSSIHSMNSSQDIQSGIYLDIMQRNEKKKYSTEGRYSTKSKISDTIHKRFGNGQIEQLKSGKNNTNFEMDWETFSKLNWKQIMGIAMVKDKSCSHIKNLLKYK